MIEKLKAIEQQVGSLYDLKNIKTETIFATNEQLHNKINELVDAVNAIQKEREAERFEIQEWIDILKAVRESVNVHEKQIDELQMKLEPEKCKAPVNPYAEQRWVGHLCKLWTGDGLVRYGILRGVALNRKKTNYPYQALSTSFEHCEPVKPDDDIIYKGGDNE